MVSRSKEATAARRPAACGLVLLADAGVVAKPDFYGLAHHAFCMHDFVQTCRKAFLKSSMAPSAWAWWRGRTVIGDSPWPAVRGRASIQNPITHNLIADLRCATRDFVVDRSESQQPARLVGILRLLSVGSQLRGAKIGAQGNRHSETPNFASLESKSCPFDNPPRAQSSATIASLIQAAKLNAVGPVRYLTDTLTKSSTVIQTARSMNCCHGPTSKNRPSKPWTEMLLTDYSMWAHIERPIELIIGDSMKA